MVYEQRRRTMDRIVFFRLHRSALVNGITDDVEHPAHDTFADGHRDWPAAIGNLEAALEALGAGHGDGPDQLIPELLLHFEDDLRRLVCDRVFDGQGVIYGGQRIRELNIHYSTDHLNDFSCVHSHTRNLVLPYSDCPPAISSNSLVILPCRSLLYSRVKSLIRPSAFSVAFFMDTMRALCSLALAFSST